MKDVLVEDGYTAERSRCPFCVVLSEIGVDGVEEWSDKGCLPCRTLDRAFAVDIHDYATVSRSRRIK